MRIRAATGFKKKRGGCGVWAKPLRRGLMSVGGGLLVLGVGHGEEVLQLPLQGLEGGPLHGVLVPALQHDVVQLGRTPLHNHI